MGIDIPEELKQFCTRIITGTILCKEGEKNQDLFILINGKLVIKKQGRIVSEVTAPGEYIGEMSSLLKIPRTATILAAGETEVLRIPADKVLDFIQHSPQLALKLATILAQRLKTMDENYVALKNKALTVQKDFIDNMDRFMVEVEDKLEASPRKVDPEVRKWFVSLFTRIRKQLKLPQFRSPKEPVGW